MSLLLPYHRRLCRAIKTFGPMFKGGVGDGERGPVEFNGWIIPDPTRSEWGRPPRPDDSVSCVQCPFTEWFKLP
ncbi:MAG: hypothetical protein AAEC86_04540 [Pseudohongiellaceae bacterium]